MTSNNKPTYKVPAKYKAYVGKAFSLRKYKNIPGINNKTRLIYDREKTFGHTILVIDECNTRVLVTTKSAEKCLWIPKFFLGTELNSDNDINSIESIIEYLVQLEYKDSKELTNEKRAACIQLLTELKNLKSK